MKKRHIALIGSVSIGITLLLTLGVTHGLTKNGFLGNADTNPYVLDMNRSVSASELSNGQTVFNTNNGNPITFKFDSSKAEVNSGGILNLLTAGNFYNDTAITGINKVDVTLSGGSATLTYGNDKNNLNVGSETLNTNGSEEVFNVNFTNPSSYFKLDVTSGPSLLKRVKVTYSCVNGDEKTPLTILFQGDSITDNSRSRINLDDLGGGYAAMVAQELENTYSSSYDFTFINRANSGWNLIENWNAGGVNHYQEEFYQYNPDIVTILIGFNDIMDNGNYGGVSDAEFEACYRELLQGLTDRNIKTICMSPFFINEAGSDYARVEFASKRQIISDLTSEFHTEYIDMKPYMMQAVEDGAYKMELFGDLVHPWAAGCRIITDLVVDKISKLIDNNYQTPANLGEYVALAPTSDNDDDFTNQRVFLSSANGRLEYDTTTFYDGGNLTSSKSTKMTNDLLNPEQSNAYTRALFDFHEEGKRDLTSGTLKVNIKVDNCLPTVSFRAFKALSSSASSNVSTSYSMTLGASSMAADVGNGWYEVSVDLASWANDQSNDALENAIAVEIALSKGESNSARQTYGVNGAEPSYMWMDNLRFDLTPTGDHRGVVFTKGYAVELTPISLNRTVKIDFKFTTDSSTSLHFILGDGWSDYFGYYKVNANGTLGGNYPGVSISLLTDGYVRVTLVLSELTNVTGSPEKINLFYIHGSWTTAEGYVDFNPSYNPGVVRGVSFTAASGYSYAVNPSIALTETINIDFKFTTGSDTFVNFILGDGWSNYFGYYRVNANGTLGGNYSGVTIHALEDGYYRVTVVLNQLDKVGGSIENINKIDLFYIRSTDWSTADGYVDFNSDAEANVIRGVSFTGSSGYSYAISPSIALTETINIDFKFTTGPNTRINMILGDGWSNYYGYFRISADGSLGGAYNGVSITYLSDGYFRVTFVLSQLTNMTGTPSKIDLFYIRSTTDWSDANGYVDFNPAV